MGWQVNRLSAWRINEVPPPEQPVVIYAEPLFGEALADQMSRVLLEPPPEWLPGLPGDFLKRKVGISTLKEMRPFEEPRFVKPAEGKVFEARVYQTGTDLPGVDQVDESLPVLWSEPVNFVLEVRCFVRGGEILAMSPYWRNGALADGPDGSWPFEGKEEQETRDFVSAVLRHPGVETPPAFVLDAGIIEGRGWAVIEGNPCWGAGLYGCPARAALEAGRAALVPKSQMTEAQWKWTSPRVRRS